MGAVATDITLSVAELSDHAFGAFCEDITGMFDVEMRCERRQATSGTVQGLREHFKKVTAVHCIKAEGTLNGGLYLVFDPGGVFVLGGVIVMLPEPRIREGLKRGSLQDADSLQDAAREAGNLLVGSWDRVFRRDCPGHKHFVKTSTFIGKPWEGAGQKELQSSKAALTILYDLTVEPYPSFTCAAVFPSAVLEDIGGITAGPANDRKTEDGQQKTDDRGQRTEDRRQTAEPTRPPASASAGAPRPASPAPAEAPAPVPKTASGGDQPRDVPAEVKKPPTPDPAPIRPGSSVLRRLSSVRRRPSSPTGAWPICWGFRYFRSWKRRWCGRGRTTPSRTSSGRCSSTIPVMCLWAETASSKGWCPARTSWVR